jgi:phytoene dehydrogenase-like protein
VVVGAGLAGLSCALRLQKAGREVTLLEASDRAGGRVRTDLIDGYRIDNGFAVLLTAYPDAKLIFDYPALDLQPFLPGARIFADGKWQMVIDKLNESQAKEMAARYEQSRVVRVM